MAKPPRTLTLLSFRRTFALLVFLVVIPSAAVSGFGVLAIINERAAVEKKLEQAWVRRLASVVDVLPQNFSRLQAELLPEGLRIRAPRGAVLSDTPFVIENGVLHVPDMRLERALTDVVREHPTFPPQPVYFSVASLQTTYLVGVLQSGEKTLGARLNLEAFETWLNEQVSNPQEGVRFVLRPVKREWQGEGFMGRLWTGVANVREAAMGGPKELAGIALGTPFQDFRLSVTPLGEDPVARASARNRAVYGVLLTIFYVTLALGVVFTGRALYREAQLSRLKTDFVSLVSHELRTPLTSIRMFIDTLALGRVTHAQQTQEVLQMLSTETERLSQMIERVLDWARIEAGKKSYQLQRKSVAEVVETAVAAFRAQRLGLPYELQYTLEEGLADLEVDAAAMVDVLLNLLQNAYKYTGAQKRISIHARQRGNKIILNVQDNGIGIARKDRKRIFERFYRADALLARKTEGSGLGLSIAERIVRAHGGKISVVSEPGIGSTFSIHLPAAAPEKT